MNVRKTPRKDIQIESFNSWTGAVYGRAALWLGSNVQISLSKSVQFYPKFRVSDLPTAWTKTEDFKSSSAQNLNNRQIIKRHIGAPENRVDRTTPSFAFGAK